MFSDEVSERVSPWAVWDDWIPTVNEFADFFAQKTRDFSKYSSHIYNSEFFVLHCIFFNFSIDSLAQGGALTL
jgi:hypothetical protein